MPKPSLSRAKAKRISDRVRAQWQSTGRYTDMDEELIKSMEDTLTRSEAAYRAARKRKANKHKHTGDLFEK